MSKAPVPSPGTRYPGLRGNLTDMFKRNAGKSFDITQLRKSFKGVSESALTYHLSQMKAEKLIDTPKRGFYILNPEHKTVEQIREEIANRPNPTRIVTSDDGFAYGKQNGITGVDTYWKRLLHRSIESLIVRTESAAPAKEVFTSEDRDLVRELLQIATGEREAGNARMNVKETAPA